MFHGKNKRYLWHFIGPLILVIAVWLSGPGKIWQSLSETNIKYLLLALSLSVPIALIKGIRWKLLLRGYDIDLSLRQSIKMYCIGMTLSAVTPSKLGDMIKIVLLTKQGASTAKSIASSIVDRLFDLMFILLVGYAGMLYFSGYFYSQLYILNIILLVVFLAALIIFLRKNVVAKALARLIPKKYRSLTHQTVQEALEYFSFKKVNNIITVSFWTGALWLVQFFAMFLCAPALKIEVNFLYFCVCSAVATTISMLPVTVAGVGTRDMVFILILGGLGVTQQQSIALSTLILALFLSNSIIFYIISIFLGKGQK